MTYKTVQKEAPGRGKVDILEETFASGEPEGEEAGRWRQKLENRDEKLKYLRSGEDEVSPFRRALLVQR